MAEERPAEIGGPSTSGTNQPAAGVPTPSMSQIVAMHRSMQQLLAASNMLPPPGVTGTSVAPGNGRPAAAGSNSGSIINDDYDPDSFLELDDPLAQYTKGMLI